MIDLKESFWSVPEEEWKRLWVRVRWGWLPKAQEQAPADTECINVAELMEQGAEESVGFRSLRLYSSRTCSGTSAASPCLLDLDLDGDTQVALDDLLDRVRGELDSRNWSYRVYRSGVGYHVEIDPISIPPTSWCLNWSHFKEIRKNISDAVDGRCAAPDGGKACIDQPHPFVRMVGSAHPVGTTKTLIDAR